VFACDASTFGPTVAAMQGLPRQHWQRLWLACLTDKSLGGRLALEPGLAATLENLSAVDGGAGPREAMSSICCGRPVVHPVHWQDIDEHAILRRLRS
jgi:hypothetical protein